MEINVKGSLFNYIVVPMSCMPYVLYDPETLVFEKSWPVEISILFTCLEFLN